MANLRSKIELKLADEHWGPFHEMLLDQRVMGKETLAWLREQGYRLSSTAFYNYRRKMLQGSRGLGLKFSKEETTAQRKRAADYAVRFDAKMVAMLALFGAFLADNGELLGKVSKGVQTAFDG